MKVDRLAAKQNKQSDEIDVVQLILVLWGFRFWIVTWTSFATIMGLLYSFIASPIYYSQATITLKESGKGNDASRIFSQLGGMGGMVASQLGLGNASLDKMEILLKGHELAEAVIMANDLMPALFRKAWDPNTKKWKPTDSSNIPTVRMGVEKLRKGVIVVKADAKKNIINVGANIYDPHLAVQLVGFYLIELNNKIRNDVMIEANANRTYLEKQINNTADPILMEKIHTMIAFEIEKYMLVSSQAFDILEKPVLPLKKSRPKRNLIVVLAFLLGLFTSIMGVLLRKGVEGFLEKEARGVA